MTDPRQSRGPDDGLEERLGRWFDDEVARARRDLASGHRSVSSRRTLRPSRRPSVAVPASILVVAALALGGTLVIGRPTARDEPAPPSGSPAAGVPTPATSVEPEAPEVDITGWYWDGIPASIGGVRVERPPLADTGRLLGGARLVGGWITSRVPGSCPAWAPACHLGTLSGGRSADGSGILAPDVLPPVGHLAVYRMEDTGSTLVWSADPATYLEDRFADGIPRHFGGQPVVRTTDLVATLAAVEGAQPVLVAGWPWEAAMRCPVAGPGAESALPPACNPHRLGDRPGGQPINGNRSVTVIPDGLALPVGPVILRVHRNDPRSAACAADERVRCEEAVVVDDVVWRGDQWTETRPLTIDTVLGRLAAADAAASAIPVARPLADGTCHQALPPVVWSVGLRNTSTANLLAGRILVFASAAERERWQSEGRAARDGLGRQCLLPGDGVVVAPITVSLDNVVIEVPKPPRGPLATHQALVDRVWSALSAD